MVGVGVVGEGCRGVPRRDAAAGAFWISALAPSFMLGVAVQSQQKRSWDGTRPPPGFSCYASARPPHRRPAASGAGFSVQSRPLMAAVAVCSFSALCILLSTQRSSASSPPQPQKKKSLFHSLRSPAAAMLELSTAAFASHASCWRGGDDGKSLAAAVM